MRAAPHGAARKQPRACRTSGAPLAPSRRDRLYAGPGGPFCT
ncbi:hypothetical protein ANACOL_01299 [Anaerotruncus colihominis DSM 17241]|uniref:Uncharacterized protein n=1 Tax=Anaerotruncus colihominis DSM 17241 TaxID=445972 RepID=B0P953_9FIRM|nr:hypothetical protein ANACOL_01299 [Anaerotruncus colihominis DSM 17241]